MPFQGLGLRYQSLPSPAAMQKRIALGWAILFRNFVGRRIFINKTTSAEGAQ